MRVIVKRNTSYRVSYIDSVGQNQRDRRKGLNEK